jgi:Zn-finger nucleic acid-binding protein
MGNLWSICNRPLDYRAYYLTAMNCPKCLALMENVTFQTIDVERCTGCGGIWFDGLEREHLAGMKGSDAIDTGDPAVGRKMNEMKAVKCPACHESMIRMVDHRHPKVQFESCPVCYGVYFDAGEFRETRNRSVSPKGVIAQEREPARPRADAECFGKAWSCNAADGAFSAHCIGPRTGSRALGFTSRCRSDIEMNKSPCRAHPTTSA